MFVCFLFWFGFSFLPRNLREFLMRLNGTLIPCYWGQKCSHSRKQFNRAVLWSSSSTHMQAYVHTETNTLCSQQHCCYYQRKGHQLMKQNTLDDWERRRVHEASIHAATWMDFKKPVTKSHILHSSFQHVTFSIGEPTETKDLNGCQVEDRQAYRVMNKGIL